MIWDTIALVLRHRNLHIILLKQLLPLIIYFLVFQKTYQLSLGNEIKELFSATQIVSEM